ncbi:MAG: hypothetical protein HQ592_00650, partial [Planctomycetes bacterium]|nr:hypothetical protein [Planctomycetota bacterium]
QVVRQAVIAVRNFVDNTHLDTLVRIALQFSDETVATILAIGEPGERAVRTLALEHHVPYAAAWLWQQGDERGRDMLVAALENEDATAVEAAECLVAQTDAPGIVDVCLAHFERLCDEDAKQVAQILVNSGREDALNVVLDMAQAKDGPKRAGAAVGLAACDDPRATRALLGLARDAKKQVRNVVVPRLLEMGDRARPCLEQAIAGDAHTQTKRAARALLADLDGVARVDAGEPLAATFFSDLITGTGHALERMIERTLQQTDMSAEIAALDALVRGDDGGASRRALGVLGQLGPPARATVEALVPFFADKKRRHWVTWTLECMDEAERE